MTLWWESLAFGACKSPAPAAVIELLKPITWFAPMWAFACGVVSSGLPLSARWLFVLAGVVLAGPLVCATSQAVNDWYDRDVDAINEPNRPIPSGTHPGPMGILHRLRMDRSVAGLALIARALGPVRRDLGLRAGLGL